MYIPFDACTCTRYPRASVLPSLDSPKIRYTLIETSADLLPHINSAIARFNQSDRSRQPD